MYYSDNPCSANASENIYYPNWNNLLDENGQSIQKHFLLFNFNRRKKGNYTHGQIDKRYRKKYDISCNKNPHQPLLNTSFLFKCTCTDICFLSGCRVVGSLFFRFCRFSSDILSFGGTKINGR